jgi:hypothetical protein
MPGKNGKLFQGLTIASEATKECRQFLEINYTALVSK